MTERAQVAHADSEPHTSAAASRLNALRAGVLGANDGIVSIAGMVIGVAAATTSTGAIATAGIAGVAAGAMSMAVGEYVSVSTQRDTEQALIAKETRELAEEPDAELAELTDLYVQRGLSPDLAAAVADQLTRHNALAAHAEVELGIDPEEYANPWQAALASMAAFIVGAALPLLAILVVPASARIPITVVAVLLALAMTGAISARLGGAQAPRAVLRNVVGGSLAMAITYAIGSLIGGQV